MILEGLVTTLGPDGGLNVAPMGPIVADGDLVRFTLRPFKTSTTYRNLKAHGEGVFHVTDDAGLIARAALGRLDEVPTREADAVRGRIITSACRYVEFRVLDLDDLDDRTTIDVESVASGRLRDFFGFNRAKHAIVEAAILATRTDFLPIDQILADFDRLASPVEKTGGPRELSAFAFLREHVERVAASRSLPDAVRVRTASRLHFGPLAWGPEAGRRFGGVGLMIDRPGLVLTARRAEAWGVTGHLGLQARASEFANRVLFQVARRMDQARMLATQIRIEQAPPEHVGLGTGTQLGLAIARAITLLAGKGTLPVEQLARLTARGSRSAIGLHGFEAGGLIVDGGKARPGALSPRVARLDWPTEWSVLVVIPEATAGLHGAAEQVAFRDLPPMETAITDRLARLVLLGVLPSVAERDLAGFSAAIEEIQEHVGRWFAPTQGGSTFAGPKVGEAVALLRSRGLKGVGQSSWGPAVYGFDDGDEERRRSLLETIREELGLRAARAFWAGPANAGATWEAIAPEPEGP